MSQGYFSVTTSKSPPTASHLYLITQAACAVTFIKMGSVVIHKTSLEFSTVHVANGCFRTVAGSQLINMDLNITL